MMTRVLHALCLRVALPATAAALGAASLAAQGGAPAANRPVPPTQPPLVVPAAPAQTADLPEVPADYVIGAEDILGVTSRYHQDLSLDVAVRPDGKISFPLLKDLVAAGLTVEELRAQLTTALAPLVKGDPAITVQPKQINSRKVYINGEVNKQGAFPLLGPLNVMQFISLAGGLTVYAKQDQILILRMENGRQVSRTFNYEQVARGQRLEQNILLQPGDTIIVR